MASAASETASLNELNHDVFPFSNIFCLPIQFDFIIHMASITVAVLINQVFVLRIYSDKWRILRHMDNMSDLPSHLKAHLHQFHNKEKLKIIDILKLWIAQDDIVYTIYSYLQHSQQAESLDCAFSAESNLDEGNTEMKELETLKQMETTMDNTDADQDDDDAASAVVPNLSELSFLQRYMQSYVDRLLFCSFCYSVCVLTVEFVTFVIIIVEFSRWRNATSLSNAWNYYNGWCICTALLQPFLRYYKFLFIYTTDFGHYHPHVIKWQHIMQLCTADRKYQYFDIKLMVHCVNRIQIILSVFLFVMWLPLLPGAILLMLAIFCFVTALGVPVFILRAVLQYLHQCYFHRIKACHLLITGIQQIAVHTMVVIVLASIHFCLYSSVLSTSFSLYGAKDVIGCLHT